jgi:cysteine synthase A
LGNALGYRTTIVIPETQSPEKIEMLMLCGAELAPARGSRQRSQPLREDLRTDCGLRDARAAGGGLANQFDNTANRTSTATPPGEIWEQTVGVSIYFICPVAPGGTPAGVAVPARAETGCASACRPAARRSTTTTRTASCA